MFLALSLRHLFVVDETNWLQVWSLWFTVAHAVECDTPRAVGNGNTWLPHALFTCPSPPLQGVITRKDLIST